MSSFDADLDLMRRCARGDEAALQRLVATYQPLVFGLAKRYLGSAEDAEEIAVSAFLKAWKSAGSFRGECSVKAHLCKIAINLCRDRPIRPALTVEPCFETAGEDVRVERVMAALQTLAPEDREVVVLYYLNEMEYSEICDALGISYDVLKTRLVRARKRLRAILEVEHV